MCPFCNRNDLKVHDENEYGFIILDSYPVTKLHSLIIPKQHTPSFFNLTSEELKALHNLLVYQKNVLLEQDPSIDSFNIGINDGKSAGQSIPHCHIHLIPRRKDDMLNPRGGVRGVIPEMQNY